MEPSGRGVFSYVAAISSIAAELQANNQQKVGFASHNGGAGPWRQNICYTEAGSLDPTYGRIYRNRSVYLPSICREPSRLEGEHDGGANLPNLPAWQLNRRPLLRQVRRAARAPDACSPPGVRANHRRPQSAGHVAAARQDGRA